MANFKCNVMPEVNICQYVCMSQIEGKPITKLSNKFLTCLSSTREKNHKTADNRIASKLILELLNLKTDCSTFSTTDFKNVLGNLLSFLKTEDSRSTAHHMFNALGGTTMLIEILRKTFYKKELSDGVIDRIPLPYVENLKLILKVLYCMGGHLSDFHGNYWLQSFLFSLIADTRSGICDEAGKVLQEINVSEQCQNVIILKNVTCLKTVLEESLSDKQKVLICSIFSGLLSVVDFISNGGDNLMKYDRWLIDNDHIKVNQENREILANIPQFVRLVIDVACKGLTASDLNELHSISQLENVNSDTELTEEFLSEHTEITPWYELLLLREKSIRPHSSVILCLLLMGVAKQKILQECLNYDLFKKLKKVVEPLAWLTFHHITQFVDPSNIDTMQNPDIFFKIQYLRLLHTIGDHVDNKYYLLSKHELSEMREIAAKYNCDIAQLSEIDDTKCCNEECGLILDVLRRLISEPLNSQSTIRFWMARSLESFLRGQPCLADQMLLVERGIVETLISSFLSTNAPVLSSDVIQCQFDLLASVMKNCVYAWIRLHKVIDCIDKFYILKNTIELNLIDSNMFVRCIILTLQYFQQNNQDEFVAFCVNKCRLLHYYTITETRIDSICNLVTILNVNKLTQENISCLNTTVTYLLIADSNDELPKYLNAISNWGEGSNKVLKNLERLLNFWIDHYSLSSRASDCSQLQESTGIAIEKWMKTVKLLLDKDNTMSPLTISHYLKPVHGCIPLKLATSSCSRFS